MKAFFKQVLAVIVGMIVVGGFFMVISFVMLVSMLTIGSSSSTTEVKEGSVLHLDLSGTIEERSVSNPLNDYFGAATQEQGLNDILAAIRVAADDARIKGIYIEGGALSADFASLEEIHRALNDFKQNSGKFIVAYGDSYTQGAYYLASTADSVWLNPEGMLDWHGIASQPIFYKELLDKIGVKMQVFRVGTYKSYVEPYTRTDMSEANRAQLQSFIDDIWKHICSDVSDSRQLPVDSLQAYADRYTALAPAESYVTGRLVDRLTYVDEVRDRLRTLAKTKKLHLVGVGDLAALDTAGNAKEGEVAVYYAYGGIVGAEGEGLSGEGHSIVGPQVVEDLDRLANDSNIKAVVIRINSGGGSAYASEQMWRAIQLLKKKKPVVVSMGGMAASGGYYMACGADYIVAEPTTLTGSIGIFGMVPDVTGLLTQKLGLHFDVVKTNEASDFGAMGRAFNDGESRAMQAYVDRGYALFLRRVAAGRRMTTDRVDSIAQGRVWTGQQALKLGLVDSLGTLRDAIAVAARRAHIQQYALTEQPVQGDWWDDLLNRYRSDYMENRVRTVLGEYYQPLRFAASLQGRDCLQARMPFEPHLR